MNKLHSRRAFSMVEVIVAAILFAVASASIFGTISHTDQTAVSNSRVRGALLGRKVLDRLSKAVTTENWTTGLLTVGSHTWPADADFPGYVVTYEVTSDASGARKVVLSIDW
jgi:type II secretory pathway pseudopilin PulG